MPLRTDAQESQLEKLESAHNRMRDARAIGIVQLGRARPALPAHFGGMTSGSIFAGSVSPIEKQGSIAGPVRCLRRTGCNDGDDGCEIALARS